MPTVASVSTEALLISVVYIGRVPVAEHESSWPSNARTTGAGSGSIILGEANEKI